jgi:hypothetical protein
MCFATYSARSFEKPSFWSVRLRSGVLLARDLVELRLRVLPALLEARVPDVERLERPPEPLLDQLRDPGDERRGQDVLEHLPHPLLGKLTILLEPARDERRSGR